MKKMKVFSAVAALLLITAGVFAGKSKFAPTELRYYVTGVGYEVLSPIGSGTDFTTTAPGGTVVQSTFTTSKVPTTTYDLYDQSGNPLYVNF